MLPVAGEEKSFPDFFLWNGSSRRPKTNFRKKCEMMLRGKG